MISHYRVLRKLRAGGAGEVYLATDERLGRKVALKLLPALTVDANVMLVFEDEARAASALNHPNLLTVYEIGSADSTVFIATEFVEGDTLRDLLARGPIPLDLALSVTLQVASALSAAHAKGLVHCDLKPENIMRRPDGLVKVLDFGLARPLPNEARTILPAADSTNTPSATISGTIGYLSAEQLQGREPDARADLWSLGVVLFEMIAGRRPFARAQLEDELRAIQNEEAPTLGTSREDVPLELESIVRRALEKNRDERYQSAAEIITDLERVRDKLKPETARTKPFEDFGENTLAAPAIAAAKESRAARVRSSFLSAMQSPLAILHRRRRWLLWTGASALLFGCGAALWMPARGGSWFASGFLIVLGSLCLAAYFALRRARPRRLAIAPQRVAFRGLVPFQEADRDSFYGRDIETGTLFAIVTRELFRFGALFGESGCGKTSLLRAGLVPKLWDEGYVPLYCRSFTDPLSAILEECRKRSRVDLQAGEAAVVYLRRVCDTLDATLIVICDQFEEFFVNFASASERQPFIDFVAACHADPDLRVKFLFSLRSDFLYLINTAFSGRVPEPLLSSKLYNLRNFDEDVAEEILERSARSAALPFEPGLIRQIARDLAVNHTVAPSEMQIVGAQLQARRVFTFDAYRRTGGKEALVHDFLEDVIQASGDAESARLLLRSLISEENTRVTLTIVEICKRIQRNRDLVLRLLLVFANARLVREMQDQEPWRYELVHEYLIDKINRVTGQVLDATQRANRHFRQYLTNYSLDQHTRIPLTRLWFIRRYSDLPRGNRENELLRSSARSGIARVVATAFVLATVTVAAAAYFSINEIWQSVRLTDGHTASARHVVFSPDGQRLVSCGEDGKVIVWDFPTRQRIATLTDHQGWVNWVDYSPDGKWFASASEDQTVIVWDSATLQKAAVLRDHRSGVSTVVFSPNGKWLVSSSGDDQRSVVWEVSAWRKVCDIPWGAKWGQFVFTPDSQRVFAGSGESWDVTTGKQTTAPFPDGGTYSSLDATGTRMLTIDGTGSVLLFDLTTHNLISKTRAHQFHGRAAIFSPDGKLAATAADDIVLWDAKTQTKLTRLSYIAEVWGLAFSPDGRWLVSSHNDGAILLWDLQERGLAASFNEHSGSVRDVAFSPDGHHLASASEDRSVIIWNVAQSRKEADLVGHNTRVTSVAFAPGGEWLASGDQDGHVIRWNMQQRQPRWNFREDLDSPAYCVAVSPDGRWVAQTNGINDADDGHRVVNFRLLSSTEQIGGQIYGLAFSPDGQTLICVTNLSEVLKLDTGTWRLAARVKLKGASLICVAFSPDGQHFVTGEDEGQVRLWETASLRQIAVVGSHQARIKSVDFSPDGSEVVSAGDDQTITLWNVARRRRITDLGTHTAPVLAVSFAPDGKHVASGGQDKSVHIYIRHRTLWGYNLD